MDPKFQTSFIPKAPITTASIARPIAVTHTSISFLSSIGTILFILAILASGGLFAYEHTLNSQIADDNDALVLAKSAFDTDTINHLVVASTQIKSAKQLLNRHIAVSNIFALLQANVLPKVKFTSFNFAYNTDGTIKVSIEGEAQSYAVMAEQSNIFSKIPAMKNQMFSDLDLTDKGAVSMKFQTNVDPTLISYSQSVSSSLPAQSIMPIGTSTTQ